MYKNKFLTFFNNYILNNFPAILFLSLTITFIVNSFFNIGLLADGTFTFTNLLHDIKWDNENRYFETFISHFAIILPLLLGVTDINFLIILHGFWIYFSTLLLLFISYLLYPTKQKHLFFLTSLSYLLTMNICSGFITSQSFIGAGLYWMIIIPLIFEDFNTISYKKLLVMIFASCFMIKGYQLDIIFITLFIISGIILIRKVTNSRKYLLLIFLAINIFSFLYITYNYIFPLKYSYFLEKSYMFKEIFCSLYLIKLVIFFIILSFLLYILIKNKRTKIQLFFSILLIFIIFGYLVKINFLFSIAAFRILNYILPLIFSLVIYIIYKKSKDIDIKLISLLNFVLLVSFILNISFVAVGWNKQLNNMYSHLIKQEGIVKTGNFFTKYSELPHLHTMISILIQKQHGISLIKSIFEPTEISLFAEMNFLPDLTKYGIYYSTDLKSIIKLKTEQNL